MAQRPEPGRNGTQGNKQRNQRSQYIREGQNAAPSSSEQGRGVSMAQTPAPDELYGVVSVLYHALQGAQTYAQYCDDARNAGDEELLDFFETCRDEESGRAARAKVLLAERLDDIEDEDAESEGDEQASEEEDGGEGDDS